MRSGSELNGISAVSNGRDATLESMVAYNEANDVSLVVRFKVLDFDVSDNSFLSENLRLGHTYPLSFYLLFEVETSSSAQ